jgi:hypothetical protein
MASSVQFYGIDKAVKAYEDNNIPSWALFCGKQLLIKYSGDDIGEGANILSQYLEMIESSNATYTLKIFEADGNTPVKIKENTPADGSFNFKLVEEEVYQDRSNKRGGINNALQSRLSAIEQKLDEADEDDEEKPDGIMGKIGDIFINEPEKIPVYLNAFQALISFLTGKPTQGTPLPAISGIPGEADGEQLKIEQAIILLKEHDKKLGDHLLKLAQMAETDKASFSMLVNMINKM